jgi:hypothetical protein
VSYADDPVCSVPVHAALVAASKTVVSVVVGSFPTLNGSQMLVDPA